MADSPAVDPFASTNDLTEEPSSSRKSSENVNVIPPTPVVTSATTPAAITAATRESVASALASATAYAVRPEVARSSTIFGTHSRQSSFIASYPSSPGPGVTQFSIGTPYGSMSRSSAGLATRPTTASSTGVASTGVAPTQSRTEPRLRTTLLPFLLRPSSMTTEPPADVRAPDGSLIEKPWLEGPTPAELAKTPFIKRVFTRKRISRFLPHLLALIGLGLGVLQCVLTYIDVSTERMDRQPLCLVMEEDFSGGEDAVFGSGGTFWREVNMDGFGNGEFEMTTGSSKNSYIKNGILYLAPTLTSEEIGLDNVLGNNGPYTYNITGCTFNQTAPNGGFILDPNGSGRQVFNYAGYYAACSATSNTTSGTIVNPIQSARISTVINAQSGSGNGSTKYGRVEIRAKMPTGDWIWPALWMLPVNNTYGAWPRSGEIDLVESRGNGISYTAHGANYVQGALNWGPTPELNSVSKSYSWWSDKRVPFSRDFHTYVLEWTTSFIRIYVDTRLHTLLEYQFNEPFFEKGDYPDTIVNGTNGQVQTLQDPWVDPATGQPKESAKNRWSAPFDQEFYLIMNVAVGGLNGWFPDGQGNKPWFNGGQNAMRSFANAQSQWYPTWPQNLDDRAMAVDYVKMWRHCDGN
ncbi:glycoside hydrolase family 16 protein [Collybiopsis luxurians FD-317 M1]|uniref:Glycoside hydrolase family 16 protein n=1 Tax=Collybiopsis luxurians FD-317 M1 TaxID=944289 RepID=A0A0D0CIG9_9AGAR|nr:glycoside hydrolase family 16 protein [Collybiopsis luxurians FD-317 M1]